MVELKEKYASDLKTEKYMLNIKKKKLFGDINVDVSTQTSGSQSGFNFEILMEKVFFLYQIHILGVENTQFLI